MAATSLTKPERCATSAPTGQPGSLGTRQGLSQLQQVGFIETPIVVGSRAPGATAAHGFAAR
jgi:hypothetical protein